MKIVDIFDLDTMSVKWDKVWEIDEFKVLINTPQSTKWHKEGNVSIHTKNVVDEVDKAIPNTEENKEYKMIMMLSALFHDIGKGTTTFFNKEKKDWSAANHAMESDNITRKLLWDENMIIRETICYLVRNHMKPLYIVENPNGTREIITISCDSPFVSKYCNFKNLVFLKKCDNLGAIFDYDEWIEKLEFASNLAIELDCYDKPYEFKNEYSKWSYFNNSFDTLPSYKDIEPTFNVKVVLWGEETPNKVSYQDIIDKTLELCDNETNFKVSFNFIGMENIEKFISMIAENNGMVIFQYENKNYNSDFVSPTLSMKNTIIL